MSRTVVAVCRGKDGTRLDPASTQRRVTTSIPGEETQAVLSSPTVASRVGEVGLAAVVHGSRTFHNWCAVLLPALGGCRENLCGADFARRGELCDTERLKTVGHAGPDEVVAPAAEADDAAVDAPGVGQGGEVGVGLEGIAATCNIVSRSFQKARMRGQVLPLRTCGRCRSRLALLPAV